VVVRPGSANRAATGCYSGVVREVLRGNDFSIPVDPTHIHPVISVRAAVKGLVTLLELPNEELGLDRSVRGKDCYYSILTS